MVKNKRSGKVLEIVNFGSFPGKTMFTCGFTFKEICKILKKQNCLDWLDAFKQTEHNFCHGVAGFASAKTLVIKGKEYYYHFLHLRDQFDFSDEAHTTLAHEVIHLCTYNLVDFLDIVKENEAFCYTHTHIMKQCYKILRERKNKK